MSAFIRILVDGYNLLHAWPDLAPDFPRHSEEARDELTRCLQQFQDEKGIPVSLIFDGSQSSNSQGNQSKSGKKPSKRTKKNPQDLLMDVEVIYSPPGMSADNAIERVAYRLKDYGRVLVITNDTLERNTVTAFGATTMSCQSFIQEWHTSSTSLNQKISHYNRKENRHFRR